MHEMRASLIHGEKRMPLSRKDAVKPAPGPEEASLGSIKIRRTEARRCDQRREPRKFEIIDTAVIRYQGRNHPVSVRNLSSRGAMIDCPLVPGIGNRIDIAFPGCNPTVCSVRWVRDGRIGLEFAKETLVLVEDRDAPIGGRREGEHTTIAIKRERQPRQVLFLRGELHWSQGSMPVKLRNISTQGMMLDCSTDIPAGSPVVVEIPGGQAVSGTVCWCRSRQVGVRFDSELDLDSLVAPPAEVERNDYVKPEYLKSDGEASSPWSARWERLSLDDL
jgi:hypothetical protein